MFGVVFAMLACLMGAWAFATPLMAVPDEPAHAIRAAAVVRGEITASASNDIPWQGEVTVPRYIAHSESLTCFAFNPQIDAGCQTPLLGDPDELVTAATSAGPNSPVFYAIVGLPTLVASGETALYAMRLMNVVVTSALLAFAAMALSQLRGARWSLLVFAVAVTPMLLFLGGSINPNAIEIAAAASLFCTLALVFREPATPRDLWIRAAIVITSTWMLVNTRSIALLWLAIIIGSALVMADRRLLRRLTRSAAAWTTVGLSLVAVCGAVLWFIQPQIEAPPGERPEYLYLGAPFSTGFQVMLDATFDQFSGWIGLFGWLDVSAPGLAIAIWTLLLATPVLMALLFGRGSTRAATIVLLVAAFLIPPIVQGVLVSSLGLIWQPRYAMAIYTPLILCAGIALDGIRQANRAPFLARIGSLAILLAAVGHLATFVWVLRRYVVGSGGWLDMLIHPEWQPPLTWIGLTAVFAFVLAVSAVILQRALHVRLAISNPAEVPDAQPSR